MNGKDLFLAMSHVDLRFIQEAEHSAMPMRRISPWLRAACLCLVLLVLWCLQPLLTITPDPPPSTDPFLPEGIPGVMVYVEELTDDGFRGMVTEVFCTELLDTGEQVHVEVTEYTMVEMADGTLGSATEAGIDLLGRYVWVEFFEPEGEAPSISAIFLSVEDPQPKG